MKVTLFVLACILQGILSVKRPDIKVGLPPLSGRIVGGVVAEDGLAPYQCSMQRYGQHLCSCAIISERWILTIAQCLEFGKSGVQILVGTNDVLAKNGTRYTPTKYIIHEEYSAGWKFWNDIGLILVDHIQFNDRVQPIKYSSNFVDSGKRLLATGWGTTSYPGEMQQYLRAINLTSISNEKCTSESSPMEIHESHLCTLTKVGEGICVGDSGMISQYYSFACSIKVHSMTIDSYRDTFSTVGTPLVLGNELVGLGSWAFKCARGRPDGFTRISYLYDWIEENIKSTQI